MCARWQSLSLPAFPETRTEKEAPDPMSLVTASHVSMHFGGPTLLEDVTPEACVERCTEDFGLTCKGLYWWVSLTGPKCRCLNSIEGDAKGTVTNDRSYAPAP